MIKNNELKIFVTFIPFLFIIIIPYIWADIQFNNSVNVKYEPEILGSLENQNEVIVIVELKDDNKFVLSGTKEERINLLRKKHEWFQPIIDKVLATLSKDEFKLIRKSSNGFSGAITKKGFYKLLNDKKIDAIYLDVPVHATLDRSVPLINANDVWSLGYTGCGMRGDWR